MIPVSPPFWGVAIAPKDDLGRFIGDFRRSLFGRNLPISGYSARCARNLDMKYAIVNEQREEAQPSLSATCPSCGSPVIAKCGEIRVKHWSHQRVRNCDPWWENETEWHREWKGQFPKAWQEFIQHSESGEKHIADVKTEQGYVIEFQRSAIKSEERQAREDFYKRMIWIVDGTRRSTDRSKLFDALEFTERVDGRDDLRILHGRNSRSALLRDWGARSIIVFFDFGENVLWGLLPRRAEETAYAFRVERSALIAALHPPSQSNSSFDGLIGSYIGKVEAHEWYLQAMARKSQNQLLRGFQPHYRR